MSATIQLPCLGCARRLGTTTRLSQPLTAHDACTAVTKAPHRRSSHTSRKQRPITGVSMLRTSVHNFEKSNWKKIKWPAVDVSSVVKAVNSLNLEFPKSWLPSLNVLSKLASRTTVLNSNKTTVDVKHDKISQDHASSEVCNDEHVTGTYISKTSVTQATHEICREEMIRNLQNKLNKEQGCPEREQHNLEQAMSDTGESIRTYYLTRKSQDECHDSSSEPCNSGVLESSGPSAERSGSLATSRAELIADTLKRLTFSKHGKSSVSAEGKESSLAKAKHSVMRTRTKVARATIERKTRELCINLNIAGSSASKLIRLEYLCQHLLEHPEAISVATKENLLPLLLRMCRCTDQALAEQARQALALVGFVPPVAGHGIRVLSLDGGGTRGLTTLEMLKRLSELSGKQPYEMFDYVIGVSTGALLACMLCVYRIPLDECITLYKDFSKEMFTVSRFQGARKLVTSYAYYDTAMWEDILKQQFGEKTFLHTTMDSKCPKVAMVSSIMTQSHHIQPFLFRNYSLPPRVYSVYQGSMQHCLWQAIRASSAAPGYYEEFKLGNQVHEDGGVLVNNPTALALHECKLLWPHNNFQCIISMGTGRFQPSQESGEDSAYSSSLKAKLHKFVQSATDTEAVHIVLHDLLPPKTYYRLNPYMSEDFELNEVRPDRWDIMRHDTQMYLRKNDYKVQAAAKRLLETKRPHQRALEWLNLQKQLHAPKWF